MILQIDDPFLRKFFNIPGQQKSKKKQSGLGLELSLIVRKDILLLIIMVLQVLNQDIKVKLSR